MFMRHLGILVLVVADIGCLSRPAAMLPTTAQTSGTQQEIQSILDDIHDDRIAAPFDEVRKLVSMGKADEVVGAVLSREACKIDAPILGICGVEVISRKFNGLKEDQKARVVWQMTECGTAGVAFLQQTLGNARETRRVRVQACQTLARMGVEGTHVLVAEGQRAANGQLKGEIVVALATASVTEEAAEFVRREIKTRQDGAMMEAAWRHLPLEEARTLLMGFLAKRDTRQGAHYFLYHHRRDTSDDLIKTLYSPDAELRLEAIELLRQTGPENICDIQAAILDRLEEMAGNDTDPRVQTNARSAALDIGHSGVSLLDLRSNEELVALVMDVKQNARDRRMAMNAIAHRRPGHTVAADVLCSLLLYPDDFIREKACISLGQIGPAAGDKAARMLLQAMKYNDQVVRLQAAAALSGKERVPGIGKTAFPAIIEVLEGNDQELRRAVARLTQYFADRGQIVVPAASIIRRSKDTEMRLELMRWVGRMPEGVETIISMRLDPDPKVRYEAQQLSAELGGNSKLHDAAIEVMKSSDPRIRQEAAWIVARHCHYELPNWRNQRRDQAARKTVADIVEILQSRSLKNDEEQDILRAIENVQEFSRDVVVKLARDPSAAIREKMLMAAAIWPEGFKHARESLSDPSSGIRAAALRAIARNHRHDEAFARGKVLEAAHDQDAGLRIVAARILSDGLILNDEKLIRALSELKEDGDVRVRIAAGGVE